MYTILGTENNNNNNMPPGEPIKCVQMYIIGTKNNVKKKNTCNPFYIDYNNKSMFYK